MYVPTGCEVRFSVRLTVSLPANLKRFYWLVRLNAPSGCWVRLLARLPFHFRLPKRVSIGQWSVMSEAMHPLGAGCVFWCVQRFQRFMFECLVATIESPS